MHVILHKKNTDNDEVHSSMECQALRAHNIPKLITSIQSASSNHRSSFCHELSFEPLLILIILLDPFGVRL